ncbi:BTB/POZ domain-containing protein KCTD7-like [Watersipora subatra]|uniref:BTB/POZ domain-containing protein KCTD7-like n=1 Tax=Watersipora subatra TaxID=2589382 RepID=UPI00355C45D5
MEVEELEEEFEEEEDIPTVPDIPPPSQSKPRHSRRRSHKHRLGEHAVTVIENLKNQQLPQLDPIVTLNVGGVYYTTLRTTLLRYPDSMLAAMFSGRHKPQLDNRGAHVIDRNGRYFGYILEFLRSGTLPSSDVASGVLSEARYYALDELEEAMHILPSISAQIVKENHRAQFPDYEENKRRILQIAMENATVTKSGDVIIYAFRTEFVPKASNFNMNHHCSADQAHISIGPWESIADEETLIKCIESDLIDEHFKVKFHEGKRRCKYFCGQSCQKCTFRIQVMFG